MTSQFSLRDYQEEAIDACLRSLERGQDALVVLSTGSGKTVTFIELLRRYHEKYPNRKSLVLMGKVLLQEQTFDEFAKRFPPHMLGSVCGSRGHYDHSKPVTIGTVKSIGHAIPDFCIMDEAHNLSPTYIKLFEKLRMLNPAMRIIGFTATPYKAGSGLIYGPGKFFENITYTKSLTWFIENNYLVKPTMKMPGEVFDTKKLTIRGGDYTPESLATLVQEEKIRKQVEDALPRLKDRKKVAWACVNILHAEMLDRILKEYNETSVTLHSKLSKQDRIDAKKAYVEGEIRHITFVTILSEGWDYPAIDAIVFCRPTKSPTLYVQTIGRSLRLAPDKSNALILDYGNVVANCGPIDDPNIFDAAKGKKKEEKPVKVCPVCDSIQALARRTCIDCDFEWPREEAEVTKNLTVKHREGGLFKGATPAPMIEEVEVRPFVTITIQKTSTGKDAAVITYHPRNMLRRPIKEWAVRDTWYFREKFQKLGMPVAHWFDVYPKKMGIQDVGLKAIVLNVAGKFPEVMRVVR